MPVLQVFSATLPVPKTTQICSKIGGDYRNFPDKNGFDWLNSKLRNGIENVISSQKNTHKEFEIGGSGLTTHFTNHPNIYLCECSFAKTFRMTEIGIYEWSLSDESRKELLERI